MMYAQKPELPVVTWIKDPLSKSLNVRLVYLN
jgi:hypothetical protein